MPDEITEAKVKQWVTEAVKDCHVCSLDEDTLSLLNDEEAVETLRTLGKGMNPNTASFFARLGRMVDQAEFALGALIIKGLVLAVVGVLIWLIYTKGQSI